MHKAPQENIKSYWVDLCMELTNMQFVMEDLVHGQWTAAKIRYSLTSVT